MKDLKIWGIQDKTEIGGFTMIGPIEADQSGCTAYVCSAADAKEIVTAVNNFNQLVEFVEELKKQIEELASDGLTQINASDTRYFRKKAEDLLKQLETK